ncbi:uncharacterized protein LOC128245040 isoform X2 [Mya arenaria]|nr:uncharacterized protein LOC128245040 isoform X2 [Mya arenaria]
MAETLQVNFEEDGFATIQMVNGENRFQLSTIQEWNRVLDTVLANNGTKGLLIRGSGRFFSNGIDLAWVSGQTGDIPGQFLNGLHRLLYRILVFPVPTAALINGHAFGAGAFLALACDYRLMRQDRGWLCWPETAIGLPFGDFLLQLSRTKIPPGQSQRDAILYSKRLDGPEAKRLQLADGLVEETKMAAEAKSLILGALGRNRLSRDVLHNTKKDIYGKELDMSKL